MRLPLALSIIAILACPMTVEAQDARMSFFVTSRGLGNGADLGGLAGADAHCQALAAAAGAGNRTWRAYLSTEVEGGRGEHARNRIGEGPWYNAHGVLIAADADELHLYNRTITKVTALNENGDQINGVGDTPNQHDILTGSMGDGLAFFPDAADHTCNSWTSSDEGSPMVGHTDRHGGGNPSWNAAHQPGGCSQADLQATGGAGLFYCFAAD